MNKLEAECMVEEFAEARISKRDLIDFASYCAFISEEQDRDAKIRYYIFEVKK